MTDVEDRIAKLERELAELKAQVKPQATTRELLDAAAKRPFQKYDPTEGFRLPASAVKAMVDVVPDFRGIAQEQSQKAERGGFLPSDGPPKERSSSWQKPVPLGPPAGVAICDQMMDVQDALDKRDLERRLLRRL
jgi:hypothetical protein